MAQDPQHKNYDVAIIGAGSAGLSARREVEKKTDNYVVIDDGPLGTTCARVGCMPSKVLIQVANDFHRRHAFHTEGISGGDSLQVDWETTMNHVRTLRDRFVRGVCADMEDWSAKLIRKRARFIDLHTIDLGDETIQAKKTIIATGTSPVVPKAWQASSKRLIDTNSFFELETFPKRVAVIGMGVIGLELGQALHRLGVEVAAVTPSKRYGGLSDPTLQSYAHDLFSKEMPVHLGRVAELREEGAELLIQLDNGEEIRTDYALLAMGRKPNLESLGLSELGLDELSGQSTGGVPAYDPDTFRILGTPWYIAGDVSNFRPILHEAADEGRIVGYNAVHDEDTCFRRRTVLAVTFSSPNIAVVGESLRQLRNRDADFVSGKVSFEGQGRAIVKLAEAGLAHVYVDRSSGALLGAELIAPDGEHLAHLLAWAVAAKLTVRQTLSLPFYHPVLEEGLRTALRDAARQTTTRLSPLEVLRCEDPPVGVIA